MIVSKANEVHLHFAECFDEPALAPYAYWLSKKMSEGHICIPVEQPSEDVLQMMWQAPLDTDSLTQMPQWVSNDPAVARPFVLYHQKLYLHRYFQYETSILQSLKRLIESGSGKTTQRMQEISVMSGKVQTLASDIAHHSGEDMLWRVDWQLVAALSAYCQQFTIITGGPGTGKTTTVAKVLSLLLENDPQLRIALAAPTGKAAMRMSESLKATNLALSATTQARFQEMEPSTIHRLLGYRFDSIYFKHDQLNPLPYDVVVVDEASMIDVALFAKLLAAVGNNTRLILLGDRNQLASVEAGSLFGDLCRMPDNATLFQPERADFINNFIPQNENKIPNSKISGQPHPLTNHVIELKKSHRFHSNSNIGKLSRAIIDNDTITLQQMMQDASLAEVSFDLQLQQNELEKIVEHYLNYIQEPEISKALAAFNRFRILCAVREGERGVYAMNKLVERLLKKWKVNNADGTPFEPDMSFYENRPVIITQNSKELELFNGDIGIVRKNDQQQYRVYFEGKDGKIRDFSTAFIGSCETVFAMTIHKSQGSEYDHVLVILPEEKDIPLLTRELLYTAVTRAKKQVVVSATANVILQTSSASVSRVSGISDRLHEIIS